MPKSIREVTAPPPSPPAPKPSPPTERDLVLAFLREHRGKKGDDGTAFTAEEITVQRSKLYKALKPGQGFLANALSIALAGKDDPQETRLARCQEALDELVATGLVGSTTDPKDPKETRWYWANEAIEEAASASDPS